MSEKEKLLVLARVLDCVKYSVLVDACSKAGEDRSTVFSILGEVTGGEEDASG